MEEDRRGSEKLESLSGEIIAALEELEAKAGEFDLPDLPRELARYKAVGGKSDYDLVVMGEAKIGKSTFVNALIGREVSPTDLNNPTTQAIKVSSIPPGAPESCRVRFEDGSGKDISFPEIAAYGSRVLETESDVASLLNGRVLPKPGETIHSIEVDTEASLLPEGVSVIDTLGLGTLYAGHDQITQRFVPEADAIIYALTSERPMGENDCDVIERILESTPNIFFIQTMIDGYDAAHWKHVASRNAEILESRFEGRLPDTTVWPVSGANLLKASGAASMSESEGYLRASRFQPLGAALRDFLDERVGVGLAEITLRIAEQYHGKSSADLRTRCAYVEGSPEDAVRIRDEMQEKNRKFHTNWKTPQSLRRSQLARELKGRVGICKASFQQALSPGGEVIVRQKQRISVVVSMKEAQRIADSMPADVIGHATAVWERERAMVADKCHELLASLVEADMRESDATSTGASKLDLHGINISEDRLRKTFKHSLPDLSMSLISLSGVLGSGSAILAGTATATAVLLPAVTAVLGTICFVGSVYRGVGQQKVKAASDLEKNLSVIMEQVNNYFFKVESSRSHTSVWDRYFKELETSVLKAVEDIANAKAAAHEKEISHLDSLMKNAKNIEQARDRLEAWDRVGEEIKRLAASLHTAER